MVNLNEVNSKEAILELRKLILDDIDAGRAETSVGSFHPEDIKKINNDAWLENFLIFHDFNVKEAFLQCWDTLEWRKKFDVNDITEQSVKKEDLLNGNIYIRGCDVDGKKIMYFRIRLYFRGSRTIDEMRNYFLYWVERGVRQSKGDQMSLVLDMQNSGVKNMDLEYVRLMISIFKNYYPNSMNYLLVYDMPFIMNGIFQIIKGLLPKKVLERMKFVNSKTAKNYIPEEHMPVVWNGSGGKDDWELVYLPEEKLEENEKPAANENNNNDSSHANLNLTDAVHFASFQNSEQNSPIMDTYDTVNHFGDMLSLNPAETIMFQKSPNSNEYSGNVEITNASKKPITYKVKTTAPDKFRVRPSSGTLSPNNCVIINVIIQKGQQILPINKDKFLVMCMSLPDESLTADEITNMWKEVTAASPDVEQHRLKCALPVNVTTAIINNDGGDYFLNDSMTSGIHHSITSSMTHNGTKLSQPMSQQHLQATVNHLTDSFNHMQQQVKSLQSLQWITIFVFVMLAIAIVYILKMEIQNQNSQYCIDK